MPPDEAGRPDFPYDTGCSLSAGLRPPTDPCLGGASEAGSNPYLLIARLGASADLSFRISQTTMRRPIPIVLLSVATLACAPDATIERSPEAPPAETTAMVTVADTELFVRTVGEGPPVLVIHGGPVLDQGYLYRALAPLGREWEMIFYDQRLSGQSSAISGPVNLDTFVQDIELLRAALGHERIDILAHSWGGLLGQMYAARYPDRVRHLILSGSVAPSAAIRMDEEVAQRDAQRPDDLQAMEEVRGSAAFQEQTPAGIESMLKASFRSGFHDPKLAGSLSFLIPEDYADRSRQFGALFPDLQDYDLTGELPAITASTLLLYGADEPGATRGGVVMAELIPDATLETIAEAGHFPFIERPEQFLGRVAEFLRTGR